MEKKYKNEKQLEKKRVTRWLSVGVWEVMRGDRGLGVGCSVKK